MRRVGEHYEVVVYTASLSKYADPLLDELDVHKVVKKRLFRENCVFHEGHYVKDLDLLDRYVCRLSHIASSPEPRTPLFVNHNGPRVCACV
jgi:carboxy-terminal domain RNA polymerase II polypeptide A small phosphatase